MPHVAQYLNPKPDATSARDGRATARIWKLNDALAPTYGLGDKGDWKLSAPNDRVLPFTLGQIGKDEVSIQLVFFRVGVGMLTVQAHPTSGDLEDWLTFLHYFRIADGQREVTIKGTRKSGVGQETPFFPEPAGGIAKNPDGGTMMKIFQALLETGRNRAATAKILADGPDPWWREVFVPGRVLPFAALYVDKLDPEQEPIVRYQLRHFFRSDQKFLPSTHDLSEDHPSLLTYAQRQWFLFSIEGGAYLGCGTPNQFFRELFPSHLQRDYFLVFLLALHQRFALIGMSEQVAEHWPVNTEDDADEGREKVFTELRDTLLSFTARGYFAQIMQRETHHRCYRKWQDVFQLERLYGEVRDEVREMHEYLQMKQAKRQEDAQKRQQDIVVRFGQIFAAAGLAFALPTLTFAYLSINLSGFGLTLQSASDIAYEIGLDDSGRDYCGLHNDLGERAEVGEPSPPLSEGGVRSPLAPNSGGIRIRLLSLWLPRIGAGGLIACLRRDILAPTGSRPPWSGARRAAMSNPAGRSPPGTAPSV